MERGNMKKRGNRILEHEIGQHVRLVKEGDARESKQGQKKSQKPPTKISAENKPPTTLIPT